MGYMLPFEHFLGVMGVLSSIMQYGMVNARWFCVCQDFPLEVAPFFFFLCCCARSTLCTPPSLAASLPAQMPVQITAMDVRGKLDAYSQSPSSANLPCRASMVT